MRQTFAARWIRRARVGLLLGLVALSCSLAYIGLSRRWGDNQTLYTLSITAGDPEGLRAQLVQVLRRTAGEKRLILIPVDSGGSVEALDMLRRGRCQVALVQGGLQIDPPGSLREVAPLHVEPLHLMVRPALADSVAQSLDALRGMRINLGEQGSGTALLAREVLRFAGLADSDYLVTKLTYGQLLSETDSQRLPDAVFTVSTLPSPVARSLATQHGYRLISLPFGQAFALAGIQDSRPPIERLHIYEATIPAFMYDLEPPVPAEPVLTLGSRLLIIARDDVPAEAIRRLIESISPAEFTRADPQTIDERLRSIAPELPRHSGTDLYLRRKQPLIGDELKEDAEKAVTIGGAAIGAAVVLAQWLYRRYRFRRDESFESYILEVAAIERQGQAIELATSPDLAELIRLQERLGDLKARALAQFAADKLQGAELLSGFLTHTSSARDYLTRLILQRREALEKQARRDGRSPESVWTETLASSRAAASPSRPVTIKPQSFDTLDKDGTNTDPDETPASTSSSA